MRVIATAAGFFDKVREPGEEFEVPQGTKASWFAPAKDTGPTEAEAQAKAEAEAQAKAEAEAQAKAGKNKAAKGKDKNADDLV